MISPLLANIALHGMEQALGITYRKDGHVVGPRAVVRYADDFVVFTTTREDAEQIIEDLGIWLAARGLTLSGEKTRIVHLTTGFDFLGWHVRQYDDPRTRRGIKLLIKPSKASITNIRIKLRERWKGLVGSNAVAVLKERNPLIRGWATYHRTVVANKIFTGLDDWMFRRAVRFVNRTHPDKSTAWKRARYWGRRNPTRGDTGVFGDTASGGSLLKFAWTPIQRHVLVAGRHSPDDPGLREYWARREAAKASHLPPKHRKIAKLQHYLCHVCGESLLNGEDIHEHHPYGRKNSQMVTLVHRYCHQQIHATTGIIETRPP